MILDQTRGERVSVTVIFDGFAEPGTPRREYLGQVSLEYAGSATADDVIIARIPQGSAAQSWVVVTDDRGLERRARNLGASVRSLRTWISRRGAQRQTPRQGAASALSAHEVAEWERFFAAGPNGSTEDENGV